jgi:hypothetical protein
MPLRGVTKTFRNLHEGLCALRAMRIVQESQGADSLPPPLRVAKTGKNHLKEEITPLHPTGIGESAELARGAL